jgi:hypothetical protein
LDAIEWVDRDRLRANDYNPNKVARPEMRLLRRSILADGWTQPIVVREDGDHFEIVDGFHRWTISKDKTVSALTDGMVPIVRITPDPASQRASTVRHNRARGTHYVVSMADIVAELASAGWDSARIGDELGMDPEEVDRLAMRGNMVERGGQPEFGRGWVPSASTLDGS